MGKKFNEQMICCCNLSRKWWWGSIHVFDSPIKFLNYLDKEGSIDFDTTNIEKVTVAYLCNRVGDDGGEWEGTDSHWAVCNPTDKGAFAVWEINLSDSSNPTPSSVPLPPDELLTDEVERYSRTFTNKYSGKGLTPSEVMELHKSEYWEGIISLILAEVDKAGKEFKLPEFMLYELADENIENTFILYGKVCLKAQIEAIKKQLRG